MLFALCALQVVIAADHLVLGTQAELEVTIVAPDASALSVRASVGRLEPPRRTGGGRWQSMFHAPPERYPQVAVLAVWTPEGDAGMAVVPLYGSAILPISVDAPRARITLEVGGAQFHGVADADGHARVAFLAPPGVRTGTVRAVDRLGNVSVREVPLGIPDAPRVLVEVAPELVTADGRASARVLAFAAEPGGRPDPGLSLAGASSARSLSAGVVAAEVAARRDLGAVVVEARASGQSVTREVRFVAGPPASIEVGMRAQGDEQVLIHARVLDAAAHPLAAAPVARVRGGTLTDFAPSGAGEFAALFRAAVPGGPGEIILRAGEIEQRVEVTSPSDRYCLRADGLVLSNLGRLAGAGAVMALARQVQPRLLVLVESGWLMAEGDVPMTGGLTAQAEVVGIPARVGVDLIPRLGAWQPVASLRAGILYAHTGVRPAALPSFSADQLAIDVVVRGGLLRWAGRWAAGILVGYDYAPVVVGDLVTGSLTGLEAGISFERRL